MDPETLENIPISTSTPSTSNMTLQKAVDLGEYDQNIKKTLLY